MENVLLEIVKSYEDVIKKFKLRSDVYSGEALAWKGSASVATMENTPFGIGDGLGTTGWCVSASEALLNDDVFQINLRFRNAKAKLISVDIKEQYHGYCYNGSQNKWHTAILVEDSGIKIVVDITCRQFGNLFIEKDIWDFESWQNAIRSPYCEHKITDFNDSPLSITPVIKKIQNYKNNLPIINTLYDLKNYTNLDGEARTILTKFFMEDFDKLNNKLILGTVGKNDLEFLNSVTETLMVLPFKKLKQGFALMAFESKDAAKNWIRLFIENECKLPNYLLLSKTLNQACQIANIDIFDMNNEYPFGNENNTTYLVLQFDNIYGVESPIENSELLLTHGLQVNIDPKRIFNAGSQLTPAKNWNTIVIQYSEITTE